MSLNTILILLAIALVLIATGLVVAAVLASAKLGRAQWLPNKDRKFGAALSHGQVVVQLQGCGPERWHFTPHERQVMLQRAMENKEDVKR